MDSFEQQKNVRAGSLTGLVTGLIIFLLFIISWTLPAPAPVPVEEGMEVNLGDSETGLGEIAPLRPGKPAPDPVTVPPEPTPAMRSPEPVREVETDDKDTEAPNASVPPPERPRKQAPLTTMPESKPQSRPRQDATPAKVTEPAPPRPKYVYKGGDASGNGGNNADSYNKNSQQGIAGGRGDQGKINGNPDSDSYTGNGGSGRSGVSISKGLSGRRLTKLPAFEDDFNENAKVAVDVRVDKSGRVTSATYQPRGSTTSNSNLTSIALRKARELRLSATESGPDEQIGTIVFNFRLKN